MTDVSLQERVELFAKERKVLKKDFARKIGITPTMLSHWLKGRVVLNDRTLVKIVAELNNV